MAGRPAFGRRGDLQRGNQIHFAFGMRIVLYACKIKKTTDGRRCGAFGETRKTLQIIAQRCFARDVQIDEQSGAAQNGQNQAQRKTDKEKAALERGEAI